MSGSVTFGIGVGGAGIGAYVGGCDPGGTAVVVCFGYGRSLGLDDGGVVGCY